MATQPYGAVVLITHSVNVLLDIVGLIFFTLLIIATVKQKNLHTACHLLIGLYFLCGFCSKFITILPFILAIVPQIGGTIPLYFCAIFHLIPVSISYGIFPLMLAIGVDRMLGIFCPIWYSIKGIKKYMAIQLLLATLYPLYIAGVILSKVIKDPTMQSNCIGMDSNSTDNFVMLAYIVLTFCCYFLIFTKILVKRNQQQSSSISQAIFKSLALIIFIQIGCWICTIILLFLLDNSTLNFEQHLFTMYSIFCFISIFTSAEMPLLYFTSSEHRLALQKQFPRIFRPSD